MNECIFCSFALLFEWCCCYCCRGFIHSAYAITVRRRKTRKHSTINNNFTNYLNNYAVHLIHLIGSCCERTFARMLVCFFFVYHFSYTLVCITTFCVCMYGPRLNPTIRYVVADYNLKTKKINSCVFEIFSQLFCLLLLVIICPSNSDLLMSTNLQMTP